jgi:hypothetical protein
MINNEKVTIQLNPKNKELTNPPLKFCKARNGRPSNQNFVFRATAFPQITEGVESLVWNSTFKTISLRIKETSKFEVYQWLKYIRDISNDLQNKPFTDLDANCVSLTIQDDGRNDVVTMRFKNTSIASHQCGFFKQENIDNNSSLFHDIELNYQFEEMAFSNNFEENEKDDEEKADEEWQTIETP